MAMETPVQQEKPLMAESDDSDEPKENVLAHPDETTDVILEVEGRELHASRAMLAHYSPVFRAMFSANFKEASEKKVSLPGKEYKAMVTFFNVLYPRSASADILIDDGNLITLLTLADEYQTDKVMTACQDYIGDQLCDILLQFYNYSVTQSQWGYGRTKKSEYDWVPAPQPHQVIRGQKISKAAMIDKQLLYLRACSQFGLPCHAPVLMSLVVDMATCLNDIKQSQQYRLLPHASSIALLEMLCSKFDQSRVL